MLENKVYLASLVKAFWFVVTHLLKSGWLTTAGLISTTSIFGGYVAVTIQALWWPSLGMADVLLPIKIAIVMGYGSLLFHIAAGILRSMKSRDIGAALAASVELVLFIGPLFALRISISDFFTRGSFIVLSEDILPWEVRVVSTFAFVLPVVFLATAVVSVLLIVILRGLLETVGEEMKKALETAKQRYKADLTRSQ